MREFRAALEDPGDRVDDEIKETWERLALEFIQDGTVATKVPKWSRSHLSCSSNVFETTFSDAGFVGQLVW